MVDMVQDVISLAWPRRSEVWRRLRISCDHSFTMCRHLRNERECCKRDCATPLARRGTPSSHPSLVVGCARPCWHRCVQRL